LVIILDLTGQESADILIMNDDLMRMLSRMADNFDKIAENTKTYGLVQRIFEWIALVVGISGILAVIDQVIQWIRG
jgi:hypothetical protein